MRIFHRLVGDPPQMGFGSVIATPGFPGGAEWAEQLTTMRLTLQVPFRLQEENVNGLVEHHEAYEYQSLRFGQPVLIRSMLGVSLNGGNKSRPHGFSHLVAPVLEGEDNLLTDCATPAQLLSFEDFHTLESFWALPSTVRTLPATEWEPSKPAACERRWAGALPEGLHTALIARYWKAASDRAFGPAREVYPLRMILSTEWDCRELIRQAKDFFAAVIVPALPEPAKNILSMSAAVPAQSMQLFQPTALAFLYPEDSIAGDERTFDLRSGLYTPLESEMDAFAKRLAAAVPSPLLTALYTQYQRETDCASPEHCPLLADFAIAYAVDRLENNAPGEPGAALLQLELWRELDELLAHRHAMPDAQRRGTLSPVMRRVLGRPLATGEALPLGEALTIFLTREALVTQDEPMLEALLTLLQQHQSARLKPLFLKFLSFPPAPDAAQRTAVILDRLLSRCFVDAPPDADTLQQLLNTTFIDACRRDPLLKDVMTRFLNAALDRHPEKHLFLLPLSTQFLDGIVLLKQSLRSLMSLHIETPPDKATCNDVRNAFSRFGTPENHHLLDVYLATLFWHYRNDPDTFYRVAGYFDADQSAAMLEILAQAALPPERLDEPLSAEEIETLTKKLLPAYAEHMRVQGAFRVYIEQTLAHSHDTGADRFGWLCSLDAQGKLLAEETRMTIGFHYAVEQLVRRGAPLPRENFQTLLRWTGGAGRRIMETCETALIDVYEKLGAAGREQAMAMLPYFNSVRNYPFLRSLSLEAAREWLVNNWVAPRDYWSTVDIAQKIITKGYLALSDVLASPVSDKGLELLMATFGQTKAVGAWLEELNKRVSRPMDAFRALWLAGLRNAYIRQYPTLLKTCCASPEDWETLVQTTAALNAEKELPGEAFTCMQAVLNAYRLIGQLPQLQENTIVRQARDVISRMSACQTLEAYPALRSMLRATYLQDARATIGQYSFFARITISLLCVVGQESNSAVQDILQLTADWPSDLAGKPYDPANLTYLQAIPALFAILARFNPEYAKSACRYLCKSEYFIRYARALRTDRKNFEHYLPWRSQRWPQPVPPRLLPLMSWLDGNTPNGKDVEHA